MKRRECMMVLNASVVEKGCDISYWQGQVDFKKMYDAGIRFVMIRAGYGTTIDKNFVTYINGAIAAGLKVGVYWFMYAKSEATARNNAKKCIKLLAPYKDKIVYGVYADWEYDSDQNAGPMTPARRSTLVRVFLTQLSEAGYEVGIYSNQDYIQSGKFSVILIKEYPLWFAKYSNTMGKYAERGLGGHPYLWQHTSKGNGRNYGVSSTYIDLDWGYITLQEEQNNTETVLDKVQSDVDVIKASDNPYPEPTRNLKYIKGRYLQYGDDVKWAQWHLWRFGLLLDVKGLPDATQIDGYWGPKCEAAQKEAEKRLGLAINGILAKEDREWYKKI